MPSARADSLECACLTARTHAHLSMVWFIVVGVSRRLCLVQLQQPASVACTVVDSPTPCLLDHTRLHTFWVALFGVKVLVTLFICGNQTRVLCCAKHPQNTHTHTCLGCCCYAHNNTARWPLLVAVIPPLYSSKSIWANLPLATKKKRIQDKTMSCPLCSLALPGAKNRGLRAVQTPYAVAPISTHVGV